MNNLHEYRLGDCVELVIDHRGKTPAKMGGDWVEDGIRVISALNVHNGFIDNEDQIRCVSEEVYKKWMTADIQKNDCFIASEGASLGENTIWDSEEKIVLGQRLYAIRTNPDILDPWYFAAYMQTSKFRLQIDQISTGSTVFGISQPVLLNVKLLLPDITEQRKIGLLYKNIKRKIENNNKINAELEAMAKTIYDYWFLQFEFPNEEGKPYKSHGGKMVWNEELKREIPEGWECKKMSKLCSFSNGINYDKNGDGDKNYKIVNVRNITASSILIDSNDLDEINLLSSQTPKYIIGENDILIARSGCPGATRLLFSNEKDIIYCGFIIKGSPKNKNHRLFLTYSLKGLEGSNATKTGGSIMQNVNQDTLKQVKVCLPTQNIIDKFNYTINPILKKMQQIIKENQELTSLLDFLLPLLMNGQVGFKEEALAYE